jgi:hypothetical protein
VHLKAGVARWFARAREYADPHLVRDVGAHGRMSAMLARDRRVFRPHPAEAPC